MVITDQPSRILKAISYTANVVTEEAKREINNTIRRGADFRSYTYSNGFENDGYDNGKGKYGEDKKDCCEKTKEGLVDTAKFIGIAARVLVAIYGICKCCEKVSEDKNLRNNYQPIPDANISGFSTKSDNINLTYSVANGRHQ